MLSSEVPSETTTSTIAPALPACGGPWIVRTSAKTVASSPTCERGDVGLLRAVDPAARVVLQQVEHVVQLHAASRSSSASPTPFSSRDGMSRRSASVSGGVDPSARVTPRRRGTGRAAGRRRGTRPRRAGTRTRCARGCAGSRAAGASQPTSTVTISLSSSTSCSEQLAHRVGRRRRRADEAVAAERDPVALVHLRAVDRRVAHGLGDLAGAHARRARPACAAAFSVARRRSGRTRRARRAPRARSCVGTTSTCLLGELVDLLRDRHDVLVVRQHDHRVGARTPRPLRGSARSTGSSTARPRRPAARRGS